MKRLLSGLVVGCLPFFAPAGPTPEQLLPDNCLALLAAPDYPRFRECASKIPWVQAWNDPAMQPLRTNLLHEMESSRFLGAAFPGRLKSLAALPNGQVALALLQNGWLTNSSVSPAFVFLCDVGANSNLLSAYLQSLAQPRTESVVGPRTQKIRNQDFSVVSVSLGDLPEPITRFLNLARKPEPSANPTNAPAESGLPKLDCLVGQAGSFLLAGTDISALDTIIGRLAGEPGPRLADSPAFQTAQAAVLTNAQGYVWIRARPLIEAFLLNPNASTTNTAPDAAGPALSSVRDLAISAGFDSIQQIAFALEARTNGLLVRAWLGLPEPSRRGLLRLLPGEILNLDPPPFIPADVESFRRWRLDGAKTWTNLQSWLEASSPQMLRVINFVLDSVNAAQRESLPGFEVRQQLMGNLGNDLMVYSKRLAAGTNESSSATVFLMGATNSDQVAVALKPIFFLLSPQGGLPDVRDFLDRKIYTVPFPSVPLPGVPNAPVGSKLHYAALTGYVAFSASEPLLEEFLRGVASSTNALPAGTNWAQSLPALGPGTTFCAWEDSRESIRSAYTAWKAGTAVLPAGGTAGALLGMIRMWLPEDAAKRWLDPTLAPPFDQLQHHFYRSISGAGGNAEGLWYGNLSPTPPGKSTP
jgi:hypothetical protein